MMTRGKWTEEAALAASIYGEYEEILKEIKTFE